VDSQKNLWVGTTRGGLNKYDFETGTFTKYYYDPHLKTGISYNYITSLAETPPGILWIGTYGGGLNRLEIESGEITHFNTAHGLPNDVIYGLLADESGNLWVSSNAGLTNFNPLSGAIRNYHVNDGLQSNEFNSGAYFRSKTGQFLFGGINGFNAFFPDSITENTHVPKLLFTDFLIHNQSVKPGPHSPLKSPIANTEKITLNHDQSVISFEFAALNYTDPQKNQFMYKLEGFDHEWQQLGNRNFITFTNLDAGNYLLHLKGSNNDGVWNTEEKSLAIVILPPWWQTKWAFALYALLLLAAIYLWRWQVINKAKLKAQIELEHMKLEKVKEMDRIKSTFFENISHDVVPSL